MYWSTFPLLLLPILLWPGAAYPFPTKKDFKGIGKDWNLLLFLKCEACIPSVVEKMCLFCSVVLTTCSEPAFWSHSRNLPASYLERCGFERKAAGILSLAGCFTPYFHVVSCFLAGCLECGFAFITAVSTADTHRHTQRQGTSGSTGLEGYYYSSWRVFQSCLMMGKIWYDQSAFPLIDELIWWGKWQDH